MRAVVFFNLVIAVAGPILTFVLIFTPLPLTLINLIGSLVFALLIPYFALGITLLYFDLEARAAEGTRQAPALVQDLAAPPVRPPGDPAAGPARARRGRIRKGQPRTCQAP